MNKTRSSSKIRTFSGQLCEARQGLRELHERELVQVSGGDGPLWPQQNYSLTQVDANGVPWDCD